jgi:hypothetical protein
MDSDAEAYIAAVETADGQSLPGYVSAAIDAFVVGAKADEFWLSIKAACFLAGPRTLAGALTPLVGAAPTNFNFVADDYLPQLGLKGNAVNKRLASNRNNNADPQNDHHMAAYVTELGDPIGYALLGDGGGSGSSRMGFNVNGSFFASRNNSSQGGPARSAGLMGVSRTTSSAIEVIVDEELRTRQSGTQTPKDAIISVFSSAEAIYTGDRLGWYSIGESLNLASLRDRLDSYMAAIAASPGGSPRRRRMMMQRGRL